ncbi:MAG: acetylglutamate kinase [Bacteroidota bacterium]|jgi:acetylglutamate kinase
MIYVIKIGGEIAEDETRCESFLDQFAALDGMKILVHGGGKAATTLAGKLGIETTMIDGRRVTDEGSLRVAVMMYAGWIGKSLATKLQSKNCNAISLCGADGNLLLTEKRNPNPLDFGFVGDAVWEGVNVKLLMNLLQQQLVPVVSAITHNGNAQLLNTNADTVAACIAAALSKHHETTLLFGFTKPGVLVDSENDATLVPVLSPSLAKEMQAEKKLHSGILPKLKAAFYAASEGVSKVYIGYAVSSGEILSGKRMATEIVSEK